MMKCWFLWTVLGGFCAVAFAQDLTVPRKRPVRASAPKIEKKNDKILESIYFNLGTHTEFINAIQNDTSGGVRKLDLKAPTLGVGLAFPLSEKFRFLHEFNWVLPRKSGGPKILKNLFMVRADLGYDPFDWLRLRAGTSLMFLNQHGSGGTAQINNGTGTSTFYYPDENRSSVNNTLDFGAEVMWDEWAFRLQSYIYSVFKEERRQYSYTLFVSYYWDQGSK